MTWVMVPVPEELAARVQVLLFQLKYQAGDTWNAGLMDAHLESLADKPRMLVSLVAAAVLDGRTLEDIALAEQLDVSVRDLFGLLGEANHCTVGPAPGDLIHSRHEAADDGTGTPRARRFLEMLQPMAQMVEDWESLPSRSSADG